jgi:hypothetical protein
MKILLITALLALSCTSKACDNPLRVHVGAFFDSSSVISYWGAFAQEIEKITKCTTTLYPEKNYKDNIINTIDKVGDIYMVLTFHTPEYEKLGLKKVLTTDQPTHYYLVTQKKYDPNDLNTLRGSIIQHSSEYTEIHLKLKSELRDKGLQDSVLFQFGHYFQSNVLGIIKGQMDAALIFSPIFDSLPASIKAKVKSKPLLQTKTIGSIMIKTDSPKYLEDAIIKAKDKINILKWVKSKPYIPPKELEGQFQAQINELLRTRSANKPVSR